MAEFEVPAEATGERLDVHLGARVGSRSAAQKLIDEGRVKVDGTSRAKRHRLSGGEVIQVAEPAPAAADETPAADHVIAYEDDHLLVVDKPAGVVVHPGGGRTAGTLVQALAGRVAGGEDPLRPGVVHRLDRDTSGLLVMARRDDVHAELKRQMSARAIEREYLALVVGRPAARAGTIDAPLGRDRRVRTRVSSDSDEPRPAVTHFTVERALPDSTLLRVRLETGRTHQIRAHLQAIGQPVAGDPEYGRPGIYGLQRQFLHAHRLSLSHPVTGARLELTSPLPPDLDVALRRAAAGQR